MIERSTVGSLLRSTQAFCSQLCEKETLTYGIAYYCPRYPLLAEVNQFREIVVEDLSRLPEANAEAEDWFRGHGLVCRCWAPAGGAASPEMKTFLTEHGFRLRTWTAMVLTHWISAPAESKVRIVPARAVRAAYRQTFLDGPSPAAQEEREALADAYGERMDDPQFDVSVALCGNEPAGRCALYQVGDIGRVMDLTVLDRFVGRGVETALLSHVLALAKRLMMRNICAQVESTDAERLRWFGAAGFVPDGSIVDFVR